MADLGDGDRLARVGLALPAPGRKTWRPYQTVGEQLWREGWAGLVAPSAARPEGRVLCVFVDDPGATTRSAVRPPTRRVGAAGSADRHADLARPAVGGEEAVVVDLRAAGEAAVGLVVMHELPHPELPATFRAETLLEREQ